MEESLRPTKVPWSEVTFDPALRSPLELAYLGDAVFELIVRTQLVCETNEPVNQLNHKAASVVNAASQSRMAGVLEPLFTEEEAAVYRRGRNAKAAGHARSAGVQEYRRATGLEAVFGYLYLAGRYERMMELYDYSVKSLNPRQAGLPVDERLYDTPHMEHEVVRKRHESAECGQRGGSCAAADPRVITFDRHETGGKNEQ